MPEPIPAVEPNPEVILFEHPDFRGAHRHVFGKEDDLSFTNKVNPINPTGNPAGGNFAGNYSALLLCWASEVMWFGDADV